MKISVRPAPDQAGSSRPSTISVPHHTPSSDETPVACKRQPSSSLRLPDALNDFISAWSVRCEGGTANPILPVGTSGKLLFHVAARLRFSKIRQQMMLCAARVVEAVTSPYSGYTEEVNIRFETPRWLVPYLLVPMRGQASKKRSKLNPAI